MKLLDDWKVFIFPSILLGLAPFVPEPHLWGKIKWIAGGAEGMKLLDWGDALMHSAPLILMAIAYARSKKKKIVKH